MKVIINRKSWGKGQMYWPSAQRRPCCALGHIREQIGDTAFEGIDGEDYRWETDTANANDSWQPRSERERNIVGIAAQVGIDVEFVGVFVESDGG